MDSARTGDIYSRSDRAERRYPSGMVVDREFRFFPVIKDETFGYVLHPVDLATNKTMAAAGRRELRDMSTW